jgi:hypothetical protein
MTLVRFLPMLSNFDCNEREGGSECVCVCVHACMCVHYVYMYM